MGLLQNLTGWHALVILAVVLLLFGAAKLPDLARSIGQSMKIVKAELKDDQPVAGEPHVVAARDPQS
ncbi:twin-arginine translocase TatA/TatE family subunit [Frigoribacterium faeni]|jgi:sec-independent protein translocase protein TatA|uniref:twin-arginine translocase TatA/TatE family subunit n=1 Tax=Frigoribacterium faeni TaxID=145483 RepID=UPI00141B7472|nr:sec-independent protein translocase protein TatA [Frigoribacterium faeni]